MLAVDTNILVHAHRRDYSTHALARQRLNEATARRWAIPWPCIHEFLAVVTNPKIFKEPTPIAHALKQAAQWLEHPRCRPLGELDDHMERLEVVMLAGNVQGARVHDARIAAICAAHGVTELWTADRDFGRFPNLRTRNPLVAM